MMTPIRGRWMIFENHETHSRGVVKPGERLARNVKHEPGVFEITELVPVPDEAAIERGALALRRVPRRAVNDEADEEQLREWARLVLRAALEPEVP